MPQVGDQATIIILDIGKNVSITDDKSENTFFYQARECATRLIERKIMSQGKNLVGIILLGAKNTDNKMAEQCEGGFKHIVLHTELQVPTWQMIRSIPESATKSRGDWIDALIVAADHFKNGISGVKLSSKKIVLMTNFKTPSCLNVDVDRILDGFKEEGFEVDIIGPDIYDEFHKGDDIDIARRFIEETNGATATFEFAMQYLLFHRKKAINAVPWNVDLSIGPNLKIPVSAYIKIKDEPTIKKWMTAIRDPSTSTASSSEGIKKQKVHINSENQSIVKEEQVIKGYVYGQQVIPLSDADKNMLYQSGDKCLSVYGFTHINNIQWQCLNSNGLSYVFGRKGDKKAQAAIACLVESLHELNFVGVVRRVYNNGNAPRMYALMPVIDTDNFICLSLIGLCFKEEIKYMSFPITKLKKYECTKEQVNAFKDLIAAMDLTKAYDDTYDDMEAFPVGKTVSPTAQYILDCIAYRAINPGKPLPQPRDDIMMLFKVPPPIEKKARVPLEEVKKLFVLNKVEKKTKKRKNISDNIDNLMKPDRTLPGEGQISDQDDIPKIQLASVKRQKTNDKIGSIDPVNDFKAFLNEGKTLLEITPQIIDVIENLIYCNLDGNYSKAMETLDSFRVECVKTNPEPYNAWLPKLKSALAQRNKVDVINLISEKNLGIILKIENNLSTYDSDTSHEDSQIYQNDTIPNYTELSVAPEVNDLFDDM